VVLIVIVLVVAAYAITVWLPSTEVHVTGANWEIHYNGITSGYFGPSPKSTCATCPMTLSKGAQFAVTLTFTSNATILTHAIDDFSVTAPFALVSVSPALPISVSPGGGATVTLTIQAPSVAGDYVIAGAMDTT